MLWRVQQAISTRSEILLLRAWQWSTAETPACSWSQSQPWAGIKASARAELGQEVECGTRLSSQAHNGVLGSFMCPPTI